MNYNILNKDVEENYIWWRLFWCNNIHLWRKKSWWILLGLCLCKNLTMKNFLNYRITKGWWKNIWRKWWVVILWMRMSKKVIWCRLFGIIIFICGERIVGWRFLGYFCTNPLRRSTFVIAGSVVFGNFASNFFRIKHCLGNNNDRIIMIE